MKVNKGERKGGKESRKNRTPKNEQWMKERRTKKVKETGK